MPTSRSSTMSMRPTPCRPAIAFRRSTSATGPQALAVQRARDARLEVDRHDLGRVRGPLGGGREHPDVVRRRHGRVLERPALVGDVPQVAVAAVDLLLGRGHRHAVRARVVDRVLAAVDRPHAPGRDDLELGGEGPCTRARSAPGRCPCRCSRGPARRRRSRAPPRPGRGPAPAGPAMCRAGSGPGRPRARAGRARRTRPGRSRAGRRRGRRRRRWRVPWPRAPRAHPRPARRRRPRSAPRSRVPRAARG